MNFKAPTYVGDKKTTKLILGETLTPDQKTALIDVYKRMENMIRIPNRTCTTQDLLDLVRNSVE